MGRAFAHLRHALLALGLLVVILAPSTREPGGFMCTRGMIEAGPACRYCHGRSSTTHGACCKWIEERAAQGSLSVVRVIDGRGAETAASPVAPLACLAPDSDPGRRFRILGLGGDSPPGSSRAPILRL